MWTRERRASPALSQPLLTVFSVTELLLAGRDHGGQVRLEGTGLFWELGSAFASCGMQLPVVKTEVAHHSLW